MKKYIYSILVLVLFAFVGCVNTEELDSDPVRNGDVRLSIRTTSGLVARATVEDTSLEERIDWVDVFVFNANAEKTIFHKERIDVSAAPVYKSGEFPLLKKREEFGENTPYYVYLVANAKANLSSDEVGVECWADLQELVQEDTDLHFSAFVDAEGKPAFAGAPARFLMDGFAFLGNPNNPAANGPEQMGTCVINDPDADDILLCGTLYRAAAKFIINIKPGSNVEFKKELLDADGIAQTPQYYINQLPVSTRVLPQQATDYYNATTQNTATTGLNPYTFVWNDNNSMTIVGYGYSDDWSKLEYTKQTSMVFNLPMMWDEDKDATNGKEASTADNWYTIPLSKEKRFERNTCYVINITVNAVGAEEKEYAIELKDIEYKALPWKEVYMDLGGYGAAFLTLNTDLVKIYDTNIDEDQLTFTSSSPIVSIKLKDTFSHNVRNKILEQGSAVIGADGLPTGEYTGTDGLYAYYIDKFGQKIQLGTDPGFDLKVVEQPEWTKEQILAKEANLYKKEGVADNAQYIRAEVWDEHKRALNGNITIHSPILPVADNEDLNWPSHFNTVRYLEFEVKNEQGITAIFRVEQTPLVVISSEEGYFSYRSDQKYSEDQEEASHFHNYQGGRSLHCTGIYFFHEHDWSKEFEQTEEWWNTNRNDRDYSWVDPNTCPSNYANDGCDIANYGYLGNAVTYHKNGKLVNAVYGGLTKPTVEPTEPFLRWRFNGIASSNNDTQGLAMSGLYQKDDGKWYRKHYVWNIQIIFYNRFVDYVYPEDVVDANGKVTKRRGAADIYSMFHKVPAQNMRVEMEGEGWAPWGLQGLTNHRMYSVNASTSNNEYTMAFPTLKADGGVVNNPYNAKMLSPNLMVASQLGETYHQSIITSAKEYGYRVPVVGEFYKIAEDQCRQYVETTFIDKPDKNGVYNGKWDEGEEVIHYDDWRLPTKTEIDAIIKFQDESRAMDKLLQGQYYFCITGAGDDADVNQKENWVSNEVPGYPSDKTGYYIRCVRDVNRKK